MLWILCGYFCYLGEYIKPVSKPRPDRPIIDDSFSQYYCMVTHKYTLLLGTPERSVLDLPLNQEIVVMSLTKALVIAIYNCHDLSESWNMPKQPWLQDDVDQPIHYYCCTNDKLLGTKPWTPHQQASNGSPTILTSNKQKMSFLRISHKKAIFWWTDWTQI